MNGRVTLWDTGKTYTEKGPMARALQDRANWVAVPCGATDYERRGDLMVENDCFYLFLFTNKEDGPSLMAKLTGVRRYEVSEDAPNLMTRMNGVGVKHNEIYKVHQGEGRRDFGHGTMGVKILKNTAEEVVLEHAGEGARTRQPIVTAYRILAGRPYLEVRPVERVNQQGMHGKSRVCAFVRGEGEDFILDAKREPFRGEVNLPAPEGTIGIINFSRKLHTDYDFMWFLTFPSGAEKHRLTYLGFHADRFWEDGKTDRPSVGAQYAYLGEGGVFIGVLNDPDNWKREEVGREIREGETYTTRFKAPYAGEWKLVARLEGEGVEAIRAANLVEDPGAEGDERVHIMGCDLPRGWGCCCDAGAAEWGVTDEEAHSGRRSVYMKIAGFDGRGSAESALTLGATDGDSGADAFDARPNTTYRFSFWLKGEGFKRELNVHGQGWKEPVDRADNGYWLPCTTSAIRATEEWRQYEGSFTTAADTRKVALLIQASGGQGEVLAGATVWVDDAILIPAAERASARDLHSRAQVAEAGQPFTFCSPVKGTLDYILVYLWDRTEGTPDSVWTPMDVYRRTIEGEVR